MSFDEIKFDNMSGGAFADQVKQKLAKKIISKAKSSVSKSDIPKAEKRLSKAATLIKAAKSSDTTEVGGDLIKTQQAATAIKEGKAQQIADYESAKNMAPPVSGRGEVITYDPNSGASSGAFPFLSGGGGGGDIPEMGYMPAARETEMQAPESAGSEPATNNDKKNIAVVVVVVVFIAVALFFILKKKK